VSRLWEHYEDQAREEALAEEASETSMVRHRTFTKNEVESVLAGHQGWLQAGLRSTSLILAVLFPGCPAAGRSRDRNSVRVSQALFASGYTPSDHSPNPDWAWTEGN